MDRLDSLEHDIDKYVLLHSILETDATLYFGAILRNVPKIMPLVYTPTVGEACQKYSKIHTNQPKGIYLSKYDKGNIANVMRNWPFAKKVKVICVTDGERILGLGDLGCNGMGIPVGKLALYTALGGIEPEGTLPMHIDFGCNVDAVRDDPLYMGLREKRPNTHKTIKEYDEFMEEFFDAVKEVFGNDCMVQFEDFGNGNAFRFLDMFQDKHCCFNDDIQGTASVALGGIMASLRITSPEEGGAKSLKDHTVLFMGAGEAGCGIASLIGETILLENPEMTREEAFSKIWLVDSSGLVTSNRDPKRLAHHKMPFAHDPPECEVDLEGDNRDCAPETFLAATRMLKPSVIVGVSGQPQVFTEEVITEMTANHKRPIVFSLSNPTSKSECTAEQAYEYSDGKAIFASGSPFPPVTVNGQTFRPAQGNNAYIFPGVGLGAIYCGATRLDDTDMITASRTLANLVPQDLIDMGAVYPDLKTAREVSVKIAVDIAKGQWERGTAQNPRPTEEQWENLENEIRNTMYHARRTHAKMWAKKDEPRGSIMSRIFGRKQKEAPTPPPAPARRPAPRAAATRPPVPPKPTPPKPKPAPELEPEPEPVAVAATESTEA